MQADPKKDSPFKPSDVSTTHPPSPSPDGGHTISTEVSETTSSLPTIYPSSWSSGYDEEQEFSSSEDRGRRSQQNSRSHSRCQSPEDLYFNPGYLLPVGPCASSPLGQAAWSSTLMDAPIAMQPAVATMPPTSPPAFAPVGGPPTLVEPQPWKEDDADASFKDRGRRAQQNSGSRSRCQSPEDLYFNPGYLLPVGPRAASPLGQAAWSCTFDGCIHRDAACRCHDAPYFSTNPPTLVEPQPWNEDDADASFKETKQSKGLLARWSRGRRGGAKEQQHRALQRAQARTSAGNTVGVR